MRDADRPTSLLQRRSGATAAATLVVLACLAPAPARADVGTWTTHGPPTAAVLAYAIDPADPPHVYASASHTVFESRDGGSRWEEAGSGIAVNTSVTSLVLEPELPGTLYAGTDGDGVYKTTDGGLNWTPKNMGLDRRDVVSLTADPTDPETLYATIGTVSEGEVVFKTTDGRTWANISSGITSNAIVALAVDPTAPETLYAGGSGLFKSTDGGASWRETSEGMPRGAVINAIAVDPEHPSTVYAGLLDSGTIHGGAYRSQNAGRSWTAMNHGLSDRDVTELVIDPQRPRTLYAGTGHQALFKSIDGAQTWVHSDEGLPDTRIPGGNFVDPILSLAIDPVDTDVVYAGLALAGGAYKSTDGADHWFPVREGLSGGSCKVVGVDPTDGLTAYSGDTFYKGMFATSNGGFDWRAINRGLDAHSQIFSGVLVDPAIPSTIYASAAGVVGPGGVFKSTDAGDTWQPSSDGLPGGVYGMALNPSVPSTLYAGTADGVYVSTDGASSWMPTGLTELLVLAVAVDPQDPMRLYAGTSAGLTRGAIYRSTDGGDSWTRVHQRPLDWSIDQVSVDRADPSVLYAATHTVLEGKVLKSIDGGDTWTDASKGLDGAAIHDVVVDPVNHLNVYASGTGGVFASADRGGSWAAFSEGLTATTTQSLAIDSTGTRLYAGTCGGGVFERDLA